jgi:predicted nucleic acid-binding protein
VRTLVCDTGPLLHLHEANLLALLTQAGDVQVPSAVDEEMVAHFPAWRYLASTWSTVHVLSKEARLEADAWVHAGLLDPGEGEAIALARELKADWLITDDAAARLFAQTLGIEVHGSLGVVLWAAATRHLDRARAEAALDRLFRTSLWISERVMDEARSALRKIFT